jgi:predicted ATPase/DNA-binding winged helix-turn-helix (wHTH) protein
LLSDLDVEATAEVLQGIQLTAEVCGKLRFADFELDLDAVELYHRGTKVGVQRKPLEVLVDLVRRGNRTVAKADLLARVWPGVRVSEHALVSAIRDLRRALGDSEIPHRIVITERGRGFRFVAPMAEMKTPRGICTNEEKPFVDREEVMGRLLSGLRASMAGTLQVTFLAGPAGIGKTRAGRELIREARPFQVEVHSGRCYAGDGAAPFWPWRHIVRNSIDRARSIPSLDRAIRHIARSAPELAGDHPRDAHEDLDGAEARFRLFDAIARLLRTLSEQRPVLLVIEDLHWADDASLLLLEFLSQDLLGARIHLVLTFRDTDVGADHPLTTVLGAAAGRPSTERIDLVGLRRESVATLLEDDFGRAPAPSFLDRAFRATGGNPFFVTELARLISRGEVDPTAPDSEVPLPVRVRDAVRLRLRARSHDCNRLLTVASVIGGEFEAAPLAHACGLSHGDTLDLLDEAVSAALLSRVAGSTESYLFVHDLVRETLYREMGPSERVRTHRQMAEALEGTAKRAPLGLPGLPRWRSLRDP